MSQIVCDIGGEIVDSTNPYKTAKIHKIFSWLLGKGFYCCEHHYPVFSYAITEMDDRRLLPETSNMRLAYEEASVTRKDY